jgi:hypothetical protein
MCAAFGSDAVNIDYTDPKYCYDCQYNIAVYAYQVGSRSSL